MTETKQQLMPVFVLCTLFLTVLMGTSSVPSGVSDTMVGPDTKVSVEEGVDVVTEEVEDQTPTEEPVVEEPVVAVVAPAGPKWASYPNVCETFTVMEASERVRNKQGKLVYPVRYKRNRYERKRSHQRRTRELVRLVAREMGADEEAQYLVDMIAHHESSWNPEAIHILNRDREANLKAWEKHSYDRGREIEIEEKMRTTSAKTKEFWHYKAVLADLRLYKGNPFWDTELEYTRKIPERTLRGETSEAFEVTERRSTWSYGYGLFGMNAVLFVQVFDKEAPPWILCGDEGIVATITAVWALREQQQDCAHLSGENPEKWGTNGGNATGVVQRFARGKCSDKKLGPVWQRLMKDYSEHVDWKSAPDFGHEFTRFKMRKRHGKWVYDYEKEIDSETGEVKRDERGRIVYKRDAKGKKIKIPADRKAILAHMIQKAEAKGLLRDAPLQRKVPDSEPVIIDKKEAAPTVVARRAISTP